MQDKTFVNAIFLGLMAWFIFACVTGQQLSAAQSSITDKVYTVAFAQDNMANDWRAAQVRQLAEFFKPYPNIRFIYSDAKGSTARQILDIENMIYAKADVLITSPRDSKIMTPVINKAYQRGIPIVLITRSIESNNYTSFVAPDDNKIARQAATYLARILHGNGRILMIKGLPTATTAIARTNGFLDELKNYPGLKVVATITGNYLRRDTIVAMQQVINKGIQFDAIYAQSDSMASGARLVLKKNHINPATKHIVGIDYIHEAQQAILDGVQDASFVYSTSAKHAGEIILKIVHGKRVPKHVVVPSECITSKNAHLIKPIF